jgi:hypothetical protein
MITMAANLIIGEKHTAQNTKTSDCDENCSRPESRELDGQ